MLPASSRVRSRTEHRLVAARGRRARRGAVVVHVVIPSSGADAAEAESMARPARGGVVVGRRVGPAVRRNLVKRRLRELLRTRLPDLPSGALVVVRALPEAGTASFDGLREDVDSALRAALSLGARQVPK